MGTDMINIVNELIEKFNGIKEIGWIKSNRMGDTGIGKTFEDMLGKEEDNLSEPDYKGIEIKSQREASSSMITLFTKSPEYPRGVNTILRENYGNSSEEYAGQKILHTTISGIKYNTHLSGYDFKVEVDRNEKKLFILIKDHETDRIVYKEAYWSFEKIKKCLEKKLQYMAYVTADEKKENNKVFFKYNSISIVTGITIDNFLDAIENGDIMIDIRIGVYHSGKSIGKTHDHGTRISNFFYQFIKICKCKKSRIDLFCFF